MHINAILYNDVQAFYIQHGKSPTDKVEKNSLSMTNEFIFKFKYILEYSIKFHKLVNRFMEIP